VNNTTLILVCGLIFKSVCPAEEPSVAGFLQAERVVAHDGIYTLAPGPRIEGVVFLQGGLWSEEVTRAFREVPWIDAASVRLNWGEFERSDQGFWWAPFDKGLAEVKHYNAEHPGARRGLHIRVMAGNKLPKWFEKAGVKLYSTENAPGRPPVRVAMPFDNPEYFRQLRQLYRAMHERYGNEPEVAVYHGTWTGALWEEMFHPRGNAPKPPGYTREKYLEGMKQELDTLIEEFCLKGKVAELPFSGEYPPAREIDIIGTLTRRVVERLGKHSPYFYASFNGWGQYPSTGKQTPSWGHEAEVKTVSRTLNVVFQALGTNVKKGGWLPQGDWIPLVRMAQQYDAAYTELYAPDFMPLDVEHHIVEAFTQQTPEFCGFRPWLTQQGRVRHEREGVARFVFQTATPRRIRAVELVAETPRDTSVICRVRARRDESGWSDWVSHADAGMLPATRQLEIEIRLRTDDSYLTPKVHTPRVRTDEPSICHTVVEQAGPEMPRADCGSVAELPGGKLLLAYMKYAPNKEGASDFGQCCIWSCISIDNGRTWIEPRKLVDVAPGDLNVQAPALLRLPSEELLMICLRAHRTTGVMGASSTMCLFRSRDNGQSFQEEPPIWERSKGQWLQGGANSLVLLKSGRILLPFHGGTGSQGAQKNAVGCFVSDDSGRTWRRTAAKIELPRRGAMEPSVAELEDGELVMSLRTQLGGPYLCRSRDAGETWSAPQPSGLEGPESCTCLRRIPGTNDLLLLWNHSRYMPKGDHFGKRTPLTAAVSSDGGRTWRIVGDLAADPDASYSDLGCTFSSKAEAIITYRYGKPAWQNLSLHALIVPKSWFNASGFDKK